MLIKSMIIMLILFFLIHWSLLQLLTLENLSLFQKIVFSFVMRIQAFLILIKSLVLVQRETYLIFRIFSMKVLHLGWPLLYRIHWQHFKLYIWIRLPLTFKQIKSFTLRQDFQGLFNLKQNTENLRYLSIDALLDVLTVENSTQILNKGTVMHAQVIMYFQTRNA